MWDSIRLTNNKSRTFLVKYFAHFTEPEIKGFAIIQLSQANIENIEKLAFLRTITDGVNSVSSIYVPTVTFFFPDLLPEDLSSQPIVREILKSKKFYWRINSFETATCEYYEMNTENLFLNAYEKGFSIESHVFPNRFIPNTRLFTAIIPFEEIK